MMLLCWREQVPFPKVAGKAHKLLCSTLDFVMPQKADARLQCWARRPALRRSATPRKMDFVSPTRARNGN